MKGYFAIGIENAKTGENVGTLWRTAHSLGAAFIFTVGHRYRFQPGDTTKAWRHIPLFQYDTFEDFYATLPDRCELIGVEWPHPKAKPLPAFTHPDRGVYLLGAEDKGLSSEALLRCARLVHIPAAVCLNVSVAGSIVLYDRIAKAA